jgi:uncharacterized protein YndB with AHSA1/START domain
VTEKHGKFEKTFELRVPLPRVWQAFTRAEDLESWMTGTVEECDVRPGGRIAWAPDEYGQLVWDVGDVEPERRLVYSEGPGILPVATEVTVTFTETEAGTRLTVTQAGFGEGEDWQAQLDNVGLGWIQTLAGLELYLLTGVRFDRFFTFRSDLGVVTGEALAGPEVLTVMPESFGAEAGLEPGDIIVQVGAAPVFTRSDLWLFTREHDAGEQVEVAYVRGGELRRAEAVLGPPM